MGSSQEPGRCTLNGYLNNYVVCLEMLEDAVRTSAKHDPPPPEVEAEIAKGKTTVYYTESPRDRALKAYRELGPVALQSWFTPSLFEARAAQAVAPIAEGLLRCRRAIDALEVAVERVPGIYDRSYVAARDIALAAFYELEALRPLVLPEDHQDDQPVEPADPHPGKLTMGITPSQWKAWESQQRAIEANPDLASAKDQEIFDWIVENDPESGYKKEHFDNWSRYLRAARRVLNRSKYSRGKPSGGRSIVRRDEL
jgi:hypothetical protein